MNNDPERIAAFLKSLDHSDKAVIRAAVDSLTGMAPRTPEIQEVLNRLLNDTSSKNRWAIAYILGQLPNPSQRCLEVLLRTLDSKDREIRWAVCLLLARLGKNNEAVVLLLRDLLKNGSSIQRRMAVYCLRDMKLKDTASLQALLESLQDLDPLVRIAAVTSLKTRPYIGKDGLNLLLHLFLEDADSRVRNAAAVTLARLGAPTNEIRTALKQASQSKDPRLRKAANTALNLLHKKGAHPTSKQQRGGGTPLW
ncbi:MAG: HEAT repeat domain-containing protein [Candidatus Binatia bacterium]